MSRGATPYPEVNYLLEQVLAGAREILGPGFAGMYVDGSLAAGGFDEDSDIDFVVVSKEAVSAVEFQALQAMHDRLAALDTPWAIQLEGFYVSARFLRRHQAGQGSCPNIERGRGERLKMVQPGQVWDIHRWVLREWGIVMAGSDPKTLIDPVPPGRLRQAVLPGFSEWLALVLEAPAQVTTRGYQSYIVLTLCRMLYTIETGMVATKPTAARWAKDNLPARWTPLIESAWVGRHAPDAPPAPADMAETLEMIRFGMERVKETGR